MILQVKDLQVSYGAIQALHGVSFDVNEGEIVTLIGANGAGKSTILRALSGLVKVKGGTISYDGKDTTKTPAHEIVKMGMGQVPEGRRVFANMTVRENLEMGAYIAPLGEFSSRLDKVFQEFPRLKEREKQLAGTLSGGEQQMLAMGRALMARPKLLLLDEPSMGLSPLLVQEIFKIIQEINKLGTTVLLVEQNAYMALSIANRAYVLETGRVVLSGDARELREHPAVKAAYLGGHEATA
ncbi:MAG TPA: ABC transporter ATP-binding protein [Symbiobacteriaceae bacterium]|nr:ABC transporter ATP-binding protein [Symbiobacteriaceae bacterium]